MNRVTLVLGIFLFLVPATARGQSVARITESTSPPVNSETHDRQALASRAIAALRRLDSHVFIYRSLGDFEAGGKLARVSFETFRNDLAEVTSEVEPILSQLPPSRLKTEITNALDSYRDGAFWWQKIDQPRVVHVSELRAEMTSTSSDAAFLSTVPYTVAIHWRQAHRYLTQIEKTIGK